MVSSSCSTTSTVLPGRAAGTSVSISRPVVALVQADRRLVEHIQGADEAGADLRREPDALRLTTCERARRS
jgi:hypothetical protein